MKRRDVLKGLSALPVLGAVGCWREVREHKPAAPNVKTRTVQILLEGAFSLVLHKNNPNQLIAFVPREEAGHPELAHDFYFNGPSKVQPRNEKEAAASGYQFELSADGLRTYEKSYINPGFNDFLADTENWRLPDRVVTLILPFPGSINFGGRPLNVTFIRNRPGSMPTNFILEYYVEDPAANIKLTCPQLGGHCEPSPNCPPGVARFFFGVAPSQKSQNTQQDHAKEFFNSTLRRCFPDLVSKYTLEYIEPSEEMAASQNPKQRSMAMPQSSENLMRPAVLRSGEHAPRLLHVSETVDCQVGGILIRTSSKPIGG
jgi:hypothetical protein